MGDLVGLGVGRPGGQGWNWCCAVHTWCHHRTHPHQVTAEGQVSHQGKRCTILFCKYFFSVLGDFVAVFPESEIENCIIVFQTLISKTWPSLCISLYYMHACMEHTYIHMYAHTHAHTHAPPPPTHPHTHTQSLEVKCACCDRQCEQQSGWNVDAVHTGCCLQLREAIRGCWQVASTTWTGKYGNALLLQSSHECWLVRGTCFTHRECGKKTNWFFFFTLFVRTSDVWWEFPPVAQVKFRRMIKTIEQI